MEKLAPEGRPVQVMRTSTIGAVGWKVIMLKPAWPAATVMPPEGVSVVPSAFTGPINATVPKSVIKPRSRNLVLVKRATNQKKETHPLCAFARDSTKPFGQQCSNLFRLIAEVVES